MIGGRFGGYINICVCVMNWYGRLVCVYYIIYINSGLNTETAERLNARMLGRFEVCACVSTNKFKVDALNYLVVIKINFMYNTFN